MRQLLEALWVDARYAVRALGNSKAFAATAVFTLGVGLALASVAFTLFNAYVLRPFAVRDPASLYEVGWAGKSSHESRHTLAELEQLDARREVFSEVHGWSGLFIMTPERNWMGALVTGNYFRGLGARLALGRGIEPSDEQAVVVLSHEAWKSAFQLDPAVLGKTVRLRGRVFEVIGVAAPEFTGLSESPPDFWASTRMHDALRKNRDESPRLLAVGRLRAGMNKARAEAALGALARARESREPLRADLRSRATVVTLTPMVLLAFSPVMFALALVLATCCANVANMMLARGLGRQREIGVRLAIGAGRARLIRQLLTEALVIAGLAGAVGLVLAQAILDGGLAVFHATAAPEFAKLVRLQPLDADRRVFAFALAAAALAAVGAALLPALQSTRLPLVGALRGEFALPGCVRASRLRDGLVVAQVVTCAVLLVCGALLYRRAAVFQAQDPAMRTSGVIDMVVEGPFEAETAEYLRTLPEVARVAAASRAPWYGRLNQTKMNGTAVGFNHVSPEYFQTFDIALRAGRGFTEEEARTDAPVAIVSLATARRLWPAVENPVGRTLRVERAEASERHLENLEGYVQVQVIGVAADAMHGWVFDGLDKTCVYLPAAAASPRTGNLLVSIRGDENRAVDHLRRAMAARWPARDAQILPLSSILAMQIYPFRAAAWLGWMLGAVAMALSVAGMYGVISYLVNQRAKEIGIRVALGATPAGIAALVLRRSAALAGLGAVVGAAIAAAAVKLLLAWSGGLNLLAWDNVALIAGATLAGGVAMAAAVAPSRRAARMDPNVVLRAD